MGGSMPRFGVFFPPVLTLSCRFRRQVPEDAATRETPAAILARLVRTPTAGLSSRAMRIAKPLLLVATPIGVLAGLYEGYRVAGGLVILMAALLIFVSAAIGMVVLTIRREQAAERAAKSATIDEQT